MSLYDVLDRRPDWSFAVPDDGDELTVGRLGVRATSTHRTPRRAEILTGDQAEVGTRNHSLNKAAFALGRLVTVGALDHEETAAALITECPRLGLGLLQSERTVASGMTAGMGCSRSVSR